MKHALLGNRGTVINSVKNLQHKLNLQHRRMEQYEREDAARAAVEGRVTSL